MSNGRSTWSTLIVLAWGWSGVAAAVEPLKDPFLEAGYAPASTARVALAENPVDAYLSGGREVYPATFAAPMAPIATTTPLIGYDAPAPWTWQVLPDGLIYRSYLAGPRESRLSLNTFHSRTSAQSSEWLWDATLGGRRGILRFGDEGTLHPEGWQVDIEGAALVRLNLDEARDVDASDFRFGVPITYGEGPWQVKFGYYHLSSHLGDELIARTGRPRINYVRDAIILGVSYYTTPSLRVYGEMAYAFFTSGGAEPWEFQFGAEYAKPGITGPWGTPFVATNAHLREESDFGGDWVIQTGWLWRGESGSTFRAGFHYANGLSTQYQFFDQFEEQVGAAIWYDY